MGEDNKEASTKRTTPEMRKASLLLSGLVLTPDSALDAFRKRRAADPDLDEVHLRRARDLLDAVADALTSTDESKWQAIERAWKAVARGAKVGDVPPPLPPSAPAPSAPAPSVPSSKPGAAPPPGSQDGVRPPPPVGTPLREDQIPKGIPQPTSGPSPWAKATARSPVGMPPAAPPLAAPPASAAPPRSAAPASSPAALNIDVDALNEIKLDDEAGTLPADSVFASGNKALPFQGQAQPPPSKVGHEARDPLGETRTAFHELDGVNQTLPFEQAELAATSRLEAMGAAPDVPASDLPPHLSHMTLEQYAALCAECAVSPQWTQQIYARYGIRSPEDRTSLDTHWQRHMAADQNVADTYGWHYARYEEWAKSRQG